MNDITKQLLSLISDFDPETGFTGAFNIREDTGCAGRQNSRNIEISSKSDKPGIDIRVKPGTKGETVYIPACVTHSKVDDLVYNDFYIGAGADVVVVAGCGVHTDGEESSQHNGIHRFYLEPGARVLYREKHIGTGEGYNGTITVAVRIADGQITGVTVVSTSDDGSYWQSATAIIDEVVEKQSTDVDSVSGATYSSKGLKEAISNALATAVIDG